MIATKEQIRWTIELLNKRNIQILNEFDQKKDEGYPFKNCELRVIENAEDSKLNLDRLMQKYK